MKITKLSCTACGAPISIPEDLDHITCTACGTGLIVERGEGYVALKVAEKIARSIEVSGIQTQEAIHENTSVTRQELQRLQMSQEITSLQMQLNGIQTEIRMLRRDVNNLKSISQLGGLERQEFQVMEQIHTLKKQAFSPNPKNFQANISMLDWECSWVDAEIAALNEGNLSKKTELINDLRRQRIVIIDKINNLKITELKKIFPSFTIPDPSADDAEQILKVLEFVDRDEANCRQYINLFEGTKVHDQLVSRQKKLRQRFEQLEFAQVQGNLSSLNMQPDVKDESSLVAYINQLEADIQTVDRAHTSSAMKSLRGQLNKSRNTATRQLKNLSKANSQSAKPESSSGFLLGIGAAIAGIVAGIGLFFAGVTTWLSKITKPTVPGGQQEKLPQSSVIKSNLVERKRNSESNPTLSGSLIWFFALVLSFLLGLGVSGLMSSLTKSTGFAVSLLVASVTIGFLLGAKAFLKRVSADIKIEEFGKMKGFQIQTGNPGKGIKNLNFIKFWVGLITFIGVLLVGLFAAVLVAEKFTGLMMLILLTSIIAAIVLSIVMAKRTTFLIPTDTE